MSCIDRPFDLHKDVRSAVVVLATQTSHSRMSSTRGRASAFVQWALMGEADFGECVEHRQDNYVTAACACVSRRRGCPMSCEFGRVVARSRAAA